jgi:hypothetical protein
MKVPDTCISCEFLFNCYKDEDQDDIFSQYIEHLINSDSMIKMEGRIEIDGEWESVIDVAYSIRWSLDSPDDFVDAITMITCALEALYPRHNVALVEV